MLLSYIDTVVQGFLTEFGPPEGAAHFFETTEAGTPPLFWMTVQPPRSIHVPPR